VVSDGYELLDDLADSFDLAGALFHGKTSEPFK
jgi:hypothetical protein